MLMLAFGHVAICLSAADSLTSPAPPRQPPRLASIFPSATTLPANHLKFYLHFTEPMQQGVFMEHCQVVDDRGTVIAEPFRETELWSEDGLRITVWLHPGRQKTGVNLNTELGPVLAPGKRYKFVVKGGWKSATGTPLGSDLEKPFFVSERITSQLEVGTWEVTPPSAGSREPVQVRFPTPMDHALLQRCLRIKDASGTLLTGRTDTRQAEQVWLFTPEQPWQHAGYQIEADAILEDLAGNSLARPFEVDLQGAPPKKAPAVLSLPFQPALTKGQPGKSAISRDTGRR